LSQRTLNKIENENPESSPFKVNLEAANYATPNLTPKKVNLLPLVITNRLVSHSLVRLRERRIKMIASQQSQDTNIMLKEN
jgi:hypothetical protein